MTKTKTFLFAALLLWTTSLFLPGIVFTNGPDAFGYNILALGWLGFAIGNVAWYANLLAVVTFTTMKERTAYYLSVLAIVIGLQGFMIHIVPQNEGRVNDLIVDHLGIGYYIWLMSLLIFVMYRYLRLKEISPQSTTKQ